MTENRYHSIGVRFNDTAVNKAHYRINGRDIIVGRIYFIDCSTVSITDIISSEFIEIDVDDIMDKVEGIRTSSISNQRDMLINIVWIIFAAVCLVAFGIPALVLDDEYNRKVCGALSIVSSLSISLSQIMYNSYWLNKSKYNRNNEDINYCVVYENGKIKVVFKSTICFQLIRRGLKYPGKYTHSHVETTTNVNVVSLQDSRNSINVV